MLDPAVAGASVNWLDVELTDPSVRKHVREGLRVDRLAIQFDELLSCVIDQEGIIRKLKLLGLNNANEAADETSDDIDDVAPLARQDAEFVLLTGTLKQLLGALKKELGGFD